MLRKLLLLVSVSLFTSQLWAEGLIVKKQKFETDSFTTFSGKTIKQLSVGWESYGELNANKDNVILITHYFTGNSHAAGKYAETDLAPGYWDSIIGPGKAIDTNKFFVISVDSLANIGAHDPNVITTGPASIDPDTGKPYGLDFPVVTIRDFVNVQKLVLESLGIHKLYAVVGASMGSFQALEWATTYPDQVERMVHVIGMAAMDAWTVAGLEKWAAPIRLDANWQQGNYYGKTPPKDGLAAAVMNITHDAMHPLIYNASFPGHEVLDQPALQDIRTQPALIQTLTQRGHLRAASMDANHLLYLVRACQLFIAGHDNNLEQALNRVKAKTLFLPASNDLLLFPAQIEQIHQQRLAQGKDSELALINGQWGHLDGIFSIHTHANSIRQFLEAAE